MSASNQHSALVDAIKLGIESYRRPGVGRDIDVYANALLSLERLEEQLETARAEAERSEKYAEERDLVAQKFEEQLETAHALLQRALPAIEQGERAMIELVWTMRDVTAAHAIREYIASNPASMPNGLRFNSLDADIAMGNEWTGEQNRDPAKERP